MNVQHNISAKLCQSRQKNTRKWGVNSSLIFTFSCEASVVNIISKKLPQVRCDRGHCKGLYSSQCLLCRGVYKVVVVVCG